MAARSTLSILGSTGSIGTQTLEVVRANRDSFEVSALSCGANVDLLHAQIEEFNPEVVAVADVAAADEVRNRITGDTRVLVGDEGVVELASRSGIDVVVGAISGFSGVAPIIAAVSAGSRVALANKEVVVAAGALLEHSGKGMVVPLDSEHTGVFQCLQGARVPVERIAITASGGPFLNTGRDKLGAVTPAEALRHPNWEMGKKITIDSATMMNKGLEVIEAAFFFDLSADAIDVLVHPQSLVHGLVYFSDGSALASVSESDMRIPISHAIGASLSWEGEAIRSSAPMLDLVAHRTLEFFSPDLQKFPCLSLAYRALRQGGNLPIVLNAANEVAVAGFLSEACGFMDIPDIVDATMSAHSLPAATTLESVIAVDSWAREYASERIGDISV